MPTKTLAATGNWSASATWSPAGVPAAGDDVVVNVAGRTATVDNTSAVCRTLTISAGTVTFSRTATSQLIVGQSGTNVVGIDLSGTGRLEIGTLSNPIPSGVFATLRILVATESMPGGARSTMATGPNTSATGIWVGGSAEFHAHGAAKDTWTFLAAQANAGATTASVVQSHTVGWAVGDEVVFSPTNKPFDAAAIRAGNQNELRTLTSFDAGTGVIGWSSGLTYAHQYRTLSWTDRFGDAWTELLRGEVANLTNNVTIRADNASVRGHTLVYGSGKLYWQNVTVRDWAPSLPSVSTLLGRYACHFHMQGAGSAGSYIRRIVFRDSPGEMVVIHDSESITVEECVFYNVSTGLAAPKFHEAPTVANESAIPMVFEASNPEGAVIFHAADRCRIFRNLFVRCGRGQNVGDFFGVPSMIWAGGSTDCLMAGTVGTGYAEDSDRASTSVHWPEGGIALAQTMPVSLKTIGHSGSTSGFSSHVNLALMSAIPDVDILVWNNAGTGIRSGAYGHDFWLFGARLIGNGSGANYYGQGDASSNLTNQNIKFGMTDFLIDGDNQSGPIGYRVTEYILNSPEPLDSTLEDGVFRNCPSGIFRHAGYSIYNAGAPIRPITAEEGSGSGLTHTRLLNCSFDSTDILYGGMSDPSTHRQPATSPGTDNQSRLRIRRQSGITGYPANFTLYMRDDPNITTGFVDDAGRRAKRVDNDTAGDRPVTPRCFLQGTAPGLDFTAAPAPDAQGNQFVTLTVNTNATGTCVFWNGTAVFAAIPISGGTASATFNMATHPQRNAFLWAHVGGALSGTQNPGGRNCSRVRVVYQPLAEGTPPADPTAPTLNTFSATSPTTLQWGWTNVANEISYEAQTAPASTGPWTTRATVGADILAATWTGASPNTAYFGRVQSVGSTGSRFPSNVIGPVTTPRAAPAAPINPNFTSVTTTTLTFNITDNSGTTGDAEDNFHMRFRTPPTTGTYGAVTTQATTTGATTGTVYSFAVTGLTAGLTYEFEAWASNSTGESPRITATITMSSDTPAAPSGLTATGPTTSTMNLNWTRNSTAETAVETQFKRSIDSVWTVDNATLPAGTISRTVPGLTPGTSYDFRVRCRNGTINSAFSNIATNSTLQPPVPAAPSNLVLGVPTTTTMPSTFNDNATDETSYEAEWRTAGGGIGSIVGRNLTSGSDGTDASSYATASVTLPANRLALLAIDVESDSTTPPTISSVAGLTATWVQVATVLYDDVGIRRGRFSVYRTMLGTQQTGAISITLSGTAQGCIWSLDEFDGMDTTGTNGSGAIVQSVTNSGITTTGTVTLAAFSDAVNNATYAAFGKTNVETQTVETGFTSLTNINAATGMTSGLLTEHRIGADTTPSCIYGNLATWGAIAIEVLRGAAGAWNATTGLAANLTSHTFTGLTANVEYDFRVRCRNASGPSGYSNIATGRTAATAPPAAPTGLAAGTITLTSVATSWTDVATTENAYHGEFRIQGASTWTVATSTLPANTTSFTFTGLQQATPYQFRVRCEASGTFSDYSNTESATTSGPPDPGVPTLSIVTAPNPTTISATWTNVTDENGYDLETSPVGAGTWTVRRTFGVDITTGSWTAATPNVQYHVRIVAFRGSIRVPSNIIAVTTPKAIPAAPTTPTFSAVTSTTLTFTVTDASGASGIGDDEDGFRGRYRDETVPATPGAWVNLADLAATSGTGTARSWNVTGLAGGRTYRFEAWAFNGTGNSPVVTASQSTPTVTPPPQGSVWALTTTPTTMTFTLLGRPPTWEAMQSLTWAALQAFSWGNLPGGPGATTTGTPSSTWGT